LVPLFLCELGIESVLCTGNVHHAFSDSVTRLYECSYGFIAWKLPLQSCTQAGEVPAWVRGELLHEFCSRCVRTLIKQ